MDDVFREMKVTHNFSDIDLAKLRLKHTPDDVLKDRNFAWESYINRRYGGKDALDDHWKGEVHHLASRDKDYVEHTHHIVMKTGLGAAGKAAAKESQEILASVGIDPFFGKENFVFAGKFPHSDKYAEMVRDRLRAVKNGGGGKAAIIEELKDIAMEWKGGRLHP